MPSVVETEAHRRRTTVTLVLAVVALRTRKEPSATPSRWSAGISTRWSSKPPDPPASTSAVMMRAQSPLTARAPGRLCHPWNEPRPWDGASKAPPHRWRGTPVFTGGPTAARHSVSAAKDFGRQACTLSVPALARSTPRHLRPVFRHRPTVPTLPGISDAYSGIGAIRTASWLSRVPPTGEGRPWLRRSRESRRADWPRLGGPVATSVRLGADPAQANVFGPPGAARSPDGGGAWLPVVLPKDAPIAAAGRTNPQVLYAPGLWGTRPGRATT